RLERARAWGDTRFRAGRPRKRCVRRLGCRLGGSGRFWAVGVGGLGGRRHRLRRLRAEDDETRRETEQPTAEVRPLHRKHPAPKNRSKRLAKIRGKFRRGANRFLRRTSSHWTLDRPPYSISLRGFGSCSSTRRRSPFLRKTPGGMRNHDEPFR